MPHNPNMNKEHALMKKVTLGHSDLQVSRLGLGLMSLSGLYGPSSDENGKALIHHALDLGIDFLDSADMYGWGHNETLLGQAMKGRSQKVCWVTKFGQVRGEGGVNTVNGRPEYVRQACEASLKRLQIDTIDLYYVHRIDPQVPIEDTVGAMSDLVRAGKVRALGLCEAHPQTIRKAHAVHPLSAIQTEYSLMYREAAEQTLAVTRELGITFVAYAPLGRSLLTATVQSFDEVADDRRKDHPRFHPEHLEHNRRLLDPLLDMARAKSCTAGQLALAWLMAQGDDIIPIPGTKRIQRLDENFAASEITLSVSELTTLDTAFPPGAAQGLRYPAGGMKGVFI